MLINRVWYLYLMSYFKYKAFLATKALRTLSFF